MIQVRRVRLPELVQDVGRPYDGEYTIRWNNDDPMLLARYDKGRWIVHSNQRRDIRYGTPFFYQRVPDELFDERKV